MAGYKGPRHIPDIHAEITGEIVRQLKEGIRPWIRPWAAAGERPAATDPIRTVAEPLPLRENGLPYSGMNVLLLWAAARERGHSNPTWMTYAQAAAHGGQVRRGETAVKVLLVRTSETTKRDPKTGEEETVTRSFLKRYPVFNCEQIDGLPPRFYAPPPALAPSADGYARVAAFFDDLGFRLVESPTRGASYDPERDIITMPEPARFPNEEDYWATLAHEVVHWTRHETRLERDLGRKAWGDEGYAREELTAEIGSAFLCADLGLAPVVRPDHARYIGPWLTKLDDDPQAIFEAAHHASKAVTWIGERVHEVRIERARVREQVREQLVAALPVPAPIGLAREAAQGRLFDWARDAEPSHGIGL